MPQFVMGPLFANLRPLTDEESDVVWANRGLAYKVAGRFWRTFKDTHRWETSLEDVKQIAMVGLIHAVQKYDPGAHEDAKFSTFAFPCIWGYLMRFSWYDRKAFGQWSRYGVSAKSRRYIRVLPIDPTTWTGSHERYADDADAPRLGRVEMQAQHLAMDAETYDPWDSVEAHLDGKRIMEAAVKDPRERRILADRADNLTLEEIGVGFGVSRERIRQLEARAIGAAYRFASGESVAAAAADGRRPRSPGLRTRNGKRIKKETKTHGTS